MYYVDIYLLFYAVSVIRSPFQPQGSAQCSPQGSPITACLLLTEWMNERTRDRTITSHQSFLNTSIFYMHFSFNKNYYWALTLVDYIYFVCVRVFTKLSNSYKELLEMGITALILQTGKWSVKNLTHLISFLILLTVCKWRREERRVLLGMACWKVCWDGSYWALV